MNDSIRLVPCRRHSAPRVWAATLLILCTALAAARLSAQQNQSVTGNLSVAGTAAVNSTAASTSSTTGALTVGGGVGVQGDVNIGGGVSATAFTAGSVIGSPSGLTLLAGGPNQNITLNPSGTGSTILNGNVGIGTAAPTAKLDVNGAVKVGTQQIRVTNSGAQLYLSGTSGGDVSGVYVGAVNEGDNANEFALAAGAEWGNASGAITSWTARATSAGIFQIDNGTFTFASAESLTNGSAFTPVPLMTLMAGGKLGLGTTNPYSRFSVRGGNIDVGGFNGGGTYGIIFTPADASSWLWQANTGNALQIGSGAAVGTLPRVTIQAAGNVGIGTASPGALLDVAGNAKVQGNADVTGTLSTGSLQIAGQPFNPANYVQQSGGVVTGTLSVTALTAAGGDITGGPSGLLLSGGGSNQNITLTPSGTGSTLLNGNVGIGTSAPNDAKLHISRSTAGAALRVTDSDGDEVSIGEFGGGANRIDVRVTDTPALRKKLLFWGGDSTNSYRMGGFQVLADNFEVRAGAMVFAGPKMSVTDSPGSFASGVEERNVFLSTGAGDADGTSAPRNWFFKSQVTGTNPVADMYGLRSALMIAGTGGTSVRGTAFMGSIALSNAMSLQDGTIGTLMPQLFGTGNIESLTYLLAAQGQFPAPGQGGDLTGTINGLVVANIGRAAAMTTTGISVADQTKGRGNVYGLRGLVAAGEGKYNLYIDGSAANVLGGQTTITNGTDSTASSSGALVVTGGAGVGKNLNVGGDAKFGGTIYGNESGLRLNTNGDRLDVMGTEMLLGADETGGRVRTDAFVKRGRWGAPHYLNAEKPVLGMWVDTRDTANNILYGGGSSVWNTATKHVFYTAPNTTTLNGTSTFTIDNTRVLVAPSTASSSTSSGALVVNGGAGIGGNLNVGGNLAVTGTFSAANFSNGVITGATGLALNAGADNQNVSFGTTGSGGVVMQRSSGKAWQRLSSATDRAFLELSGASNQTNGAAPDGFYAGLYLKAQDGMVGNYASIENSNQAGLPNARLNFVNLSHAATNAAGAVDILTGAPVGGSLARVARFDAAGLSISTGLLAGGLGGLTLSAGAADQNVSLVTSGAGIVTTNARLGIGISASTALADGVKLQLHSADSSQTQLYFTNSDSGITASDGLRVGLGAALTALVWNNENAALRFGTNNAEQARITETGEVLLGTVTRSGNGRLQLADHTTAAGGIGLGSDVSIFRSGIGELSVSTAGGLATKWDINRNQLILGDIRPVSPDAVDLGAPSLSMRAIYGRTMLVTGTAASTSKDTGALIVEGGTGIEGNVNAGGSLGVAGDAAVHGGLTVDSATTLKSGLTVTGPTLLAGMLTATSGAVINGTTNLQTASVAGTSSFGDTMTFASAGNTMGTISWGTTPIVSTQLVAGTGRSLLLGANGSATTGLTVAPSANVGVGTTSPTEALHVLRTGSNAGLYLETVGTGNPAVFMKQGSGSKYLVLDLNPANIFSIGWDSPVARIGTGGAERVRVDADGNVGIGTSNPGEKLEVVGNGKVRANLYVNTDGGTADGLTVGSSSGGANIRLLGAGNRWNLSNNSSGQLQFSRSNADGSANANALSFGSDGKATFAQQLTAGAGFTSRGDVSINGTVALTGSMSVTSGTLDLGGNRVVNVAYASGAGDATSKSYVDGTNPLYWSGPEVYVKGTVSRIGFGTTNPEVPLDIRKAATDGEIARFMPSAGWTLRTYLRLNSASDQNWWEFSVQDASGGGTSNGLALRSRNGTGASQPQMYIDVDGNVGIGTTQPQGNKLAVNGTIHAKEVVVDTTGWSDFVFQPGYRNAPLHEVEEHIKEHKHLPGVPSAQEVTEKGVSVGQMQAVLLAKVEELTLHLIEQEKRIERLEAENAALRITHN